MKNDKNNEWPTIGRPQRKKNRLEHYAYSSPGGYFLTICTSERRNYFWEDVGATIGRPQDVILSQYGNIVNEAINNIQNTTIENINNFLSNSDINSVS